MGIRGAHGLLATHQAHLGAAWGTLKFHFLGVPAGLMGLLRFLLMASYPHQAWFCEHTHPGSCLIAGSTWSFFPTPFFRSIFSNISHYRLTNACSSDLLSYTVCRDTSCVLGYQESQERPAALLGPMAGPLILCLWLPAPSLSSLDRQVPTAPVLPQETPGGFGVSEYGIVCLAP